MQRKVHEKGFTLIELMITVAIIGILSAIAIPSFQNYRMRSKTAEAEINLKAIVVSQVAYLAEWDTYIDCTPSPAAIPTGGLATWSDEGANPNNFTTIGWVPKDSQVYFQYSVSSASNTNFIGLAEGDVDGDGGAAGDLNNSRFNATAVTPVRYLTPGKY